jgi:hypothetical protein
MRHGPTCKSLKQLPNALLSLRYQPVAVVKCRRRLDSKEKQAGGTPIAVMGLADLSDERLRNVTLYN